ncbi:2-oxoacid:acceptor oxidoreductase family protein [Desulforhopalus singaporensis]|uniref:2-oxoglutarate ferredoxin oxidoreductase subunit gamma n=1 Tax=Desulforhopalus singaporensis TaxID=91360 RepID=A0A1H0L909_9BACT|nr:2-oxoacid:acceptor oxidoreductase family protein [Desulforhopalus singaporensis]SDO64724.1 2-oxoglutarate ferredoxin oxidoreductase subunit gamma [Desulforhopalus singaporensis]
MFNERILCAGFGGQGIMSLGQLLAYGGMSEERHVSWIPSYGPEMRGGTAYCSVVLSEKEVGSPIVTTNATTAVIMNTPSLIKFEKSVISGGIILVNSSLVNRRVTRKDVNVYYIPAVELAGECGNQQAANIVMLGAYLALTQAVTEKSIISALPKVFGEKPKKFIDLNRRALELGQKAVLGHGPKLAAA